MKLRSLGSLAAGWKPGPLRGPTSSGPLDLLEANWTEIVGAWVAAHSMPLELRATTLIVATRTSAWSQQLQLLSPHILEAVQALDPSVGVERLAFRSGGLRRRAPTPRAKSARRAAAPTDPSEPARDAGEALAHLRRRITRTRRAAASTCSDCGAPTERARASCAPCAAAELERRRTGVERVLFAAPWLDFTECAALVRGLRRSEFEAARRHLLARWWAMLERARRSRRLSATRLEHQIASSYVLLQSGIAPDRISPAVVRNVLGDELEELLYGAEQTGATSKETSR